MHHSLARRRLQRQQLRRRRRWRRLVRRQVEHLISLLCLLLGGSATAIADLDTSGGSSWWWLWRWLWRGCRLLGSGPGGLIAALEVSKGDRRVVHMECRAVQQGTVGEDARQRGQQGCQVIAHCRQYK